jgi:glycosyltransferase involved in cell wall biosynthesis
LRIVRVVVDGKFASPRFGGIGAYSINLIAELASRSDCEVEVLVPSGVMFGPYTLPRSAEGFKQTEIVRREMESMSFFDARRYWEQVVLAEELGGRGVDVFFNPAFMRPLGWRGASVVTVHDLAFEYEGMNPGPNVEYYRAWARRSAEASKAVVVDSDFGVEEVLGRWGLERGKVHRTYLAPATRFVPSERKVATTEVEARLGVSGVFALHVGSALYARKNLGNLLRAFAQENVRELDVRLVLVGEATRELRDRAATLGIRDRVTITGRVEPDLLPYIYRAAEVLVFPSSYEGFGLPPLEAMACGCPVIVGNAGAVREVVGAAGIAIDGESPSAIAGAIALVVRDRATYSRLTAAGTRRAKEYSWSRCAEETWAVLRGAAKG